jgi:hypothetical protein
MVSLLLLTFLAQEFYLESPPLQTRAEALELQAEATALGLDAQISRRYGHGSGWEFLVVVEGFESADTAQTAAVELAQQAGRGITVYQQGGEPVVAGPVTEQPAESAEPELPDAGEVLARASRALGGQEGGLDLLERSCCVRFRYERTVTEGSLELAAQHDFARSGSTTVLSLIPLDDAVVPSVTVIQGDQVWLETEAGLQERDLVRAQEVLVGFAPEAMLHWPLRFAGFTSADPRYGDLQTIERLVQDDTTLLVLENGQGDLRLHIDEATWRPTRIRMTSDGGTWTQSFSDWRELDVGLVVPFEVSVQRDGTQVESIRVAELSLVAAADVDALAAAVLEADPSAIQAP